MHECSPKASYCQVQSGEAAFVLSSDDTNVTRSLCLSLCSCGEWSDLYDNIGHLMV